MNDVVDLNAVSEAAKEAMSPEVATMASRLVINNDEQYQGAANVLLEVKSRIKAIEEKRKGFTAPLNKVVKEINAFFKEPRSQYEQAEAAIKRAMADFNMRAAAERQKALQAAAAEASQGNTQGFTSLMEKAHAQPPPTAAGTHTVTRWRFEVTDPSQVPREYLVVDERKIREVVTKLKGDTRIPGVRVYEDTAIVARG